MFSRDDIHFRSIKPTKRLWIRPSTIRRNVLIQENGYDFIFRKVRGILNKLTLDNFTKLSNDLLKVDLNSDVILKGVILLIFDKALDEPQYSSIYAQLCKRLSDEAPNFKTSNQFFSDQKGQSAFRILLLSKCKAEFEKRSRASEDYENQNDLGPEEEEQRRQKAKRRMLGNIKFIGELGKLKIVAEPILHRCIQQLLWETRWEGSRGGAAVVIECLCQIMRTCGRILDSDKGRNLMDQYFKHMSSLTESSDLTLRIHFMLLDVIKLRRNGWVSRKATSTEGPMFINQIRNYQRESTHSDGGGYYSRRGDRFGNDFLRKIPRSGIDVDIVTSIPLSSLTISSPFSSNDYSNNLGNNYCYNQHNQSARNYFPDTNRHQNNFKHNQQEQHNALNYINDSKMPNGHLEEVSPEPSNLFPGRSGEPLLRIHFTMDFTIQRILVILMSIIFVFFYIS